MNALDLEAIQARTVLKRWPTQAELGQIQGDNRALVARVKDLEATLGRAQTALTDIRHAEHLGFELDPKETVTHLRAAIEGNTK